MENALGFGQKVTHGDSAGLLERAVSEGAEFLKATSGRKKGDPVSISLPYGSGKGVCGKIVGWSREGQFLMLGIPHRYRFTEKGYVVDPHEQLITIPTGLPLVIANITERHLRGLEGVKTHAEQQGNNVKLLSPDEESTYIGRVDSAFDKFTYLQPFVKILRNPLSGFKVETRFPLEVDSKLDVMDILSVSLEEYAEKENAKTKSVQNGSLVLDPRGEIWTDEKKGRPYNRVVFDSVKKVWTDGK